MTMMKTGCDVSEGKKVHQGNMPPEPPTGLLDIGAVDSAVCAIFQKMMVKLLNKKSNWSEVREVPSQETKQNNNGNQDSPGEDQKPGHSPKTDFATESSSSDLSGFLNQFHHPSKHFFSAKGNRKVIGVEVELPLIKDEKEDRDDRSISPTICPKIDQIKHKKSIEGRKNEVHKEGPTLQNKEKHIAKHTKMSKGQQGEKKEVQKEGLTLLNKEKPPKHPKLRKDQQFMPPKRTSDHVLKDLIAKGVIVLPKVANPTVILGKRVDLFCKFHQARGHDLEECFVFKDIVRNASMTGCWLKKTN